MRTQRHSNERRDVELCSLPTDTTGELDVLGHDGDTLGVDGAQVGVLEQTHQVSLAGLLKSTNSCTLETQVCLEVLGNFTNQALERELADEQLCGLLGRTDQISIICRGGFRSSTSR